MTELGLVGGGEVKTTFYKGAPLILWMALITLKASVAMNVG